MLLAEWRRGEKLSVWEVATEQGEPARAHSSVSKQPAPLLFVVPLRVRLSRGAGWGWGVWLATPGALRKCTSIQSVGQTTTTKNVSFKKITGKWTHIAPHLFLSREPWYTRIKCSLLFLQWPKMVQCCFFFFLSNRISNKKSSLSLGCVEVVYWVAGLILLPRWRKKGWVHTWRSELMVQTITTDTHILVWWYKKHESYPNVFFLFFEGAVYVQWEQKQQETPKKYVYNSNSKQQHPITTNPISIWT